MRILFPIHNYPPYQVAGAEVYTSGLCEALSNTDEVAVVYPLVDSSVPTITLRKNVNEDSTIRYEIVGNFSNLQRMFYDIHRQERRAYLDAFSEVIADFSPDIIHFQHLMSYPALELLDRMSAYSVPIVYTLHDHWFICPAVHYLRSDEKPCTGPQHGLWTCAACMRHVPLGLADSVLGACQRIGALSLFEKIMPSSLNFKLFLQRDRIMEKVLSHIDVLISPSRSLADRIAVNATIKGKIRHIPYGHHPLPPCSDAEVPEQTDAPTAGFIGTFTRGKGVHLILQAAEVLQEQFPELEIRLYGYTHDPEFKRLLEESVTRLPNVHLMGPYQRKTLACILAQFDCLLVPSIWYETSSLVIAEAFFAGKPVITSNQGGMVEMLVDGTQGGLVFEPGNAQDLARKLICFFQDSELRQKTYETIPPVVTFEQHILELRGLYSELLSKSR